MRRRFYYLVVLFSGLTAMGCGGGSDDSSRDHFGVFLDAPVKNLSYTSPSHSGRTNDQGQFRYRENESVTFRIGDIELGVSVGQAIVSPFELVLGADGVSHPSVSNRLRFLQTLDKDNNPANGIEISESVRTAAIGMSIDFDRPVAEFEADTSLDDFIADQTMAKILVTQLVAEAHFAEVIRDYHLEAHAAANHIYKLIQNLDPRWSLPVEATFTSTEATSYNLTRSFIIDDSFGFSHTVNLFFVKEDLDSSDPLTGGLANTWSLYVEVDNGQQVGGSDPDNPEPARYILRFDTDGSLLTPTYVVVSNWTPLYSAEDSARPLGPAPDNPTIYDPPKSSNFKIDLSSVKFGEDLSL
ncbi:MAG: hypothetical protein KJ950_09440 [Proteobacteria bacterium]|nr:hypothetical protein [Pseudomonadota bacterium]MBU1687621.1 hypothetical protein [Pseudomonadota bacterium]